MEWSGAFMIELPLRSVSSSRGLSGYGGPQVHLTLSVLTSIINSSSQARISTLETSWTSHRTKTPPRRPIEHYLHLHAVPTLALQTLDLHRLRTDHLPIPSPPQLYLPPAISAMSLEAMVDLAVETLKLEG